MKFLLDTDHISILQWKSEPGFTQLSARLAQLSSEEYGASVVSLHEQSLGCHTYLSRAKDAAGYARGYQMFELILSTYSWETEVPFDSDAAKKYLELTGLGLRVAAMDLRVAAIALVRDLTVLSRNTSDFGKVPGVKTADWSR